MVTRNINIIEDLSSLTGKTLMVNGCKSGLLKIKATSITGTATISTATGSDGTNFPFFPSLYMGDEVLFNNFVLNAAGEYTINIDFRGAKYLKIGISKSEDFVFEGSCSIACFPDYFEFDNKGFSFINKSTTEIIKLNGIKQLDLHVEFVKKNTTDTTARYIRIEGSSDDGETWENGKYFNSNGYVSTLNWVNIAELDQIDCFADVSAYNKVRLTCSTRTGDVLKYSYSLSAEAKTRTLLVNGDNSIHSVPIKGYRYVKAELSEATPGTATNMSLKATGTDSRGLDVVPTLLNCAYENLMAPRLIKSSETFMIKAQAVKGGVVFDFREAMSSIVLRKYSGSLGIIKLTLSNEKPNGQQELISEKNNYAVYKTKGVLDLVDSANQRDAYGTDVLEYNAHELYFFEFGYDGICYKIVFDETTFEGIKEGEEIKYAYLMPMHNLSACINVGNRILVITNKSRMLYLDQNSNYTSISKTFTECAIINPYSKWLPVNTKSSVDSTHKYFPVLKNFDYSQFSGKDQSISDRLPCAFPTEDGLSRLTWNNMARSSKLTLFGNYNFGLAEPMVLGTDDGGKTWVVLKWFAFTSDYATSMPKIDLSSISEESAYVGNSLKLCIRKYVTPTTENPDPETFVIDENEDVLVSSFSTDSDGDTIVNLSSSKDYGNYRPVCFFKNMSASSEWDYICNSNMQANGNGNNGIFFRLQKVSNTQYKLLANIGNPYDMKDVAFHVHCVNACSSGFVISTGESYTSYSYEGGNIYYLPQTYTNGNTQLLGSGIYSLLNKTLRLTYSQDGPNRASGAYLFNDSADPTFLYVSDRTGDVRSFTDSRGLAIPNTAAGIFEGKLSNMASQMGFKCICEVNNTMISLCENMGHFAADGQNSYLCLSKDGKVWTKETGGLPRFINGININGDIYFGDRVVKFK